MSSLHPDLRRHNALVFFGCLVVGALGAFMAVAGALDLEAVRQVPTWILIGFGAIFLGIGYLGVVVVPRRYREATRVVASGNPVQATAVFKVEQDTDSASLVARLRSRGPVSDDEISLLIPRWDVEPILGSPIKVGLFVEPERESVVAIQTDHGLLWSIPSFRWSRRK